MNDQNIEDLSMALIERLLKHSTSVRAITNKFDKDIHLPFGSGITLFYYLLAHKIIRATTS